MHCRKISLPLSRIAVIVCEITAMLKGLGEASVSPFCLQKFSRCFKALSPDCPETAPRRRGWRYPLSVGRNGPKSKGKRPYDGGSRPSSFLPKNRRSTRRRIASGSSASRSASRFTVSGIYIFKGGKSFFIWCLLRSYFQRVYCVFTLGCREVSQGFFYSYHKFFTKKVGKI